MKRDVRSYARLLMKIDEIDPETEDLRPVAFATDHEVKQFARTKKQEHGPSLDNFRLDLGAVASPWNKRAATVFTEGFLAVGEYPCQDYQRITKTFIRHLATIRAHYKKARNDEASTIMQRDALIQRARIMRRRNVGAPIHHSCQC